MNLYRATVLRRSRVLGFLWKVPKARELYIVASSKSRARTLLRPHTYGSFNVTLCFVRKVRSKEHIPGALR